MNLDDLIYKVPKALIVFVGIFIAIGLAFLNDPPSTICDVQKKVIQSGQEGFLFLDPKKTYIKSRGYTKYKNKCYEGNSLGACLQFFTGMEKLDKQLSIVDKQCIKGVLQIPILLKAIPDTLSVLQNIAWNGKPPKNRYEMRAWLGANHMYLFCKLKKWHQIQTDRDAYSQWRERLMQSLPGANKLNRKELWSKVLFSIPCKSYVR